MKEEKMLKWIKGITQVSKRMTPDEKQEGRGKKGEKKV